MEKKQEKLDNPVFHGLQEMLKSLSAVWQSRFETPLIIAHVTNCEGRYEFRYSQMM